ncbi:unnamed protein product [Blepharisma stoltei]|uniref:EF-hand domain-containing protein n=1 Tax=Blepharisma stoltei TaxID=1481888 RepID=A0AAU9ID51_9CILI|nr:unnamed protein product [Blepharisma stoltei]
MGQILIGLKLSCDINILKPVVQPALMLTKWTKDEIMKILKRFWKLPFNRGFFLSKGSVKVLALNTPMEGLECQIFKCFARGSPPKLNALELMSGILIYGSISIEQKAKLTIRLFDFDGNGSITIDECAMMCTAFLNAIGCMTSARMPPVTEIYDITEAIFDTIDQDSSHEISYTELVAMIQSIRDLFFLLRAPEIKSSSYQFQLPPVVSLKSRMVRSSTPNKRISIKHNDLHLKLNTTNKSPRIKVKSFTDRELNGSKERFMFVNGNYITKLWVTEIKKEFIRVENKKTNLVNVEIFAQQLKHNDLTKFSAEKLSSFTNEIANFQEVLEILCEGATRDQIHRMLSWADEIEPVKNGEIVRRDSRRRLTIHSVKNLKQLFDFYDKKKLGELGLREIKDAFKHILNEELIESIFKAHDENDNKTMDFEEFVKMMIPTDTLISEDIYYRIQANLA